ncbi:JAB domain-containing protein [Paenibacillus sp. RC73]
MEAGKIIGITMLDHVVVGRDGWLSMKEQGMM